MASITKGIEELFKPGTVIVFVEHSLNKCCYTITVTPINDDDELEDCLLDEHKKEIDNAKST